MNMYHRYIYIYILYLSLIYVLEVSDAVLLCIPYIYIHIYIFIYIRRSVLHFCCFKKYSMQCTVVVYYYSSNLCISIIIIKLYSYMNYGISEKGILFVINKY